jgi:small nuclear ribonucleoprotein (snRNP)-like protein
MCVPHPLEHCPALTIIKAYDGHMNLILSDVEETIVIVDTQEGAPPSQAVINVYLLHTHRCATRPDESTVVCKTEDGDAFCKRRWCYIGAYSSLLYRYATNATNRYPLLHEHDKNAFSRLVLFEDVPHHSHMSCCIISYRQCAFSNTTSPDGTFLCLETCQCHFAHYTPRPLEECGCFPSFSIILSCFHLPSLKFRYARVLRWYTGA